MTDDSNKLEIIGNPGTGNTFGNNIVQHADNVNITQQGTLMPSVLTEIINKLATVKTKIDFDGDINVDVIYISNKVKFNELNRWARYVNYFTPNSIDVDSIYLEFDRAGSSKTMRVMFTLKMAYDRLSDDYKGDKLFDKMLEYVLDVVGNDLSRDPKIYREDVEYNARIVLVDAFIKCEIFEKPE